MPIRTGVNVNCPIDLLGVLKYIKSKYRYGKVKKNHFKQSKKKRTRGMRELTKIITRMKHLKFHCKDNH